MGTPGRRAAPSTRRCRSYPAASGRAGRGRAGSRGRRTAPGFPPHHERFESLATKHDRQHFGERGVVVDNKDPWLHGSHGGIFAGKRRPRRADPVDTPPTWPFTTRVRPASDPRRRLRCPVMGQLIAIEGLDGAGKNCSGDRADRHLAVSGAARGALHVPRYGQSVHPISPRRRCTARTGICVSVYAMALMFARSTGGRHQFDRRRGGRLRHRRLRPVRGLERGLHNARPTASGRRRRGGVVGGHAGVRPVRPARPRPARAAGRHPGGRDVAGTGTGDPTRLGCATYTNATTVCSAASTTSITNWRNRTGVPRGFTTDGSDPAALAAELHP